MTKGGGGGQLGFFNFSSADHIMKTHAEIRKSSYSQESDIQILPSVTCGECGHAERTQNAMNTHLRLCLAKPQNLDFGCDFQSATIIALVSHIKEKHCTVLEPFFPVGSVLCLGRVPPARLYELSGTVGQVCS